MLDGINALLQSFGLFWSMMMDLPFIGQLTWGYFIIAVVVLDVFMSFLLFKFK